MSVQNTLARSLHDVGLAAWFGGSLMGAVGLNGASGEVHDPGDRARVANAGWARWTPVNAAAIAAHLLGGAQITRGNKGRLLVQPQSRWVNGAKAALTVGALGVTAYSRWQGQQLMSAEASRSAGVPVEDAVTPTESTPDQAARPQRQLTAMQWLVPASTGALLVLNAKAGEQQRPGAILRDALRSGAPTDLAAVPWRTVAGTVLGLLTLRRIRRRATRRSRRAGGAMVRDIMSAGVASVSPDDSLRVAARRMIDHNVGALPVCDADQRLKGMLTDRDIVTRAVAVGADLSTTTVGEVAADGAVTVRTGDSVRDVVRTMARHKVRRVPVVDGGRVVGIVSQADVASNADDAVTGELVELISEAP